MERGNYSVYADFILLGLFSNTRFPWLLFALILLVFVTSVASNMAMIILIHMDSRLHTPMYFLLSQLSLMDILYISTIVPKMLVDQVMSQRAISFAGCTAQHFLYLTLAGAEFFLLGLMSCDRYIAICNPLCYPVLMSRRICRLIVAAAWLGGSVDGFLLTTHHAVPLLCLSGDQPLLRGPCPSEALLHGHVSLRDSHVCLLYCDGGRPLLWGSGQSWICVLHHPHSHEQGCHRGLQKVVGCVSSGKVTTF
uniref:G-protein coupled receptors family 1 profile domain-containing protein n=1 Tax=Colobus angolensis palliatus TaxID=336983 RepID=A0A2K5HAM3_COLAP